MLKDRFHPALQADKYDLDPAVLPKIEALADLMIQGGMEDAGQRIKKRCREGSEPLLRRPSQLKPPVPYLPSNISGQPTLLDFHPEEMARQLALLQQRLFVKIKPRELLGKLWSGSDKERASPNVLAVIQEYVLHNSIIASNRRWRRRRRR